MYCELQIAIRSNMADITLSLLINMISRGCDEWFLNVKLVCVCVGRLSHSLGRDKGWWLEFHIQSSNVYADLTLFDIAFHICLDNETNSLENESIHLIEIAL